MWCRERGRDEKGCKNGRRRTSARRPSGKVHSGRRPPRKVQCHRRQPLKVNVDNAYSTQTYTHNCKSLKNLLNVFMSPTFQIVLKFISYKIVALFTENYPSTPSPEIEMSMLDKGALHFIWE